MNHSMAKLKRINQFDGSFFGIMNKMGDQMDASARILLETTYESIVDSGLFHDFTRHSFTVYTLSLNH